MDSTSDPDESLVEKAREGDMGALDARVRQHQLWVFNLALHIVFGVKTPCFEAVELRESFDNKYPSAPSRSDCNPRHSRTGWLRLSLRAKELRP